MCRGQAYDGASTMQGVRSGLATRIRHDNPAALSVHCLAHCLNLRLQEEGRKLPFIRDALDLVRDIAKLIAFSPKCAHLLSQNLSQSDTQGVNIKPLCPNRLTARTGAIGAILTDYPVLMDTLDEVQQTTKDEYGLKAAGLLSGMEKFSMLFGLKLGYLMFGASETLSKSLQGKDTTIQEAIGAANLAKGFYKRQRTDQAFESFTLMSLTLQENMSLVILSSLAIEGHQEDLAVEASLIGTTHRRNTLSNSLLKHVTFLEKHLKRGLTNTNL